MKLNDLLKAMSEDFAAKSDPAVLQIMRDARQELVDRNLPLQALGVGERMTDFVLCDSNGEDFSSREARKRGPLLICWYRGIWCPYCNAELEALQEILPEIVATGATLVAISPMQQKYAANLVRNLGLGFPLLLDPDNRLAREFRMVFKLPQALQEVYLELGIDLARFNGNTHGELPLPGRYIVDRDGMVVDAELHPDHTRRPEPRESLLILQRLTSAA